MVNAGTRSEGCFKCRARRIKCDAGKPECQRCVKYGVACPGYPEKPAYSFLDETSRVRDRAILRYQRTGRAYGDSVVERSAGEEDSVPKVPLEDSTASAPRWESDQLPSLNINAKHVAGAIIQGAVSSFMRQWGVGHPELLWAGFDSPAIMLQTEQSLCLPSVIEAISLIAVHNGDQVPHTDFRKLALQSYGRALSQINRAVNDPNEQLLDHTLQAVLLVVMFEGLSEQDDRTTNVAMHLAGLITMIRLRGPKQFDTHVGRTLVLTSFMLYNNATILTSRPTRAALPKSIWKNLFKNEIGPFEPTFRLLPILDFAAQLRRTGLETLAGSPSDLHELLDSIENMDAQLEMWHNTLPNGINPTDYHAFFALNTYRGHRILLKDLRLRCYWCLNVLEVPSRGYAAEIRECISQTKILVDDICASTPYDFAPDDPHARRPGTVASPPGRGVLIGFHLMFSFPLLVSSMVYPVSKRQNDGIVAARWQCARACGLSRPFRTLPRSLLNPTNATGEPENDRLLQAGVDVFGEIPSPSRVSTWTEETTGVCG